MLILPSPPRRGWLQSWWLAVSLLTGTTVGGMAALAGLGGRSLWLGLVVTVGNGVAGLFAPGVTGLLYAKWNICAVLLARAASAIVRRLCFYVVLVAVGRAGSSLELERPTAGRSLWVSRGVPTAATYLHPHRTGAWSGRAGSWPGAYVRWALGSNNVWAVWLLPFWVILSMCASEEPEAGVPSHTYTLY